MKQIKTTTNTVDSVSEKRRKLLKVALTAAPVVATLRSGSLLANASAYTCVADNRHRYVTPVTPYNEYATESTDQIVRLTVPEYTFEKPDKKDELRYVLPSPHEDSNQYVYDATNNILVQDNVKDGYVQGAKTDNVVYAQIYWRINDTDSDTLGVYEIDVRDKKTDTGPKTFVTETPGSPTSLDGSCLCSIDPNACNIY